MRFIPSADPLRVFGVVWPRGGSIPLTFGLGNGILRSVEALKAGIVGPVGGTIWNLFTISMAFLTFKVNGRKVGST